MAYRPEPIDTTHISLDPELLELMEQLARNVHDTWATRRLEEGWRFGKRRDDTRKKHPDLVDYDELPDSEKEYDRESVKETLKAILSLGYRISGPSGTGGPSDDPSDALVEQLARQDMAGMLQLWRKLVQDRGNYRADVFRRAGNRFLDAGESLLAYDVLREGLAHHSTDLGLRQLKGLALARSGATQPAHEIAKQLEKDLSRSDGVNKEAVEEVLGLLARTYKDLWEQEESVASKQRYLKRSYSVYLEAFQRTRGYWSGINAATLALVLGRKAKARRLAQQVEKLCRGELGNGESYWVVATLGEAALILGEFGEAEEWYRRAARIAGERFGHVSSTRRNARFILQHLDRDTTPIDRCLRVPSVVVFDGNEPALQPEETRITRALQQQLRRAFRDRLRHLDVGWGYALATSQSGILFLEEILERKARSHIVLPYEVEDFKRDCSRRFRSHWRTRFDRLIEEAAELVCASTKRLADEPCAFEYTENFLRGLAIIRAAELETDLIPVVLQQNQNDGTSHGVSQYWGKRGYEVQRIGSERIGAVSRDPSSAPSGSNRNTDRGRRIMAMVCADAVGYSQLDDGQIRLFARHFLGRIARLLRSRYQPALMETFGDGLYFVFSTVREAGLFALDLSDRLNRMKWSELGLPEKLAIRLATHVGPVHKFKNPITRQINFTGAHASWTARIEPVTPPGQVYASQPFAALAVAEGIAEFSCDYVGQIPLAKGYGTFRTYHLRRTFGK